MNLDTGALRSFEVYANVFARFPQFHHGVPHFQTLGLHEYALKAWPANRKSLGSIEITAWTGFDASERTPGRGDRKVRGLFRSSEGWVR